MTTANQRDRILKKAYEIWESEGRQGGRDMEHWLQAELLIGHESKPARKPRKTAGKAKAAAKPRAKTIAKAKTKPVTKPRAKATPKTKKKTAANP